MQSYRTKHILSVGCKYRQGIVTKVECCDGGWLIIVTYKTVPDKQFFVYH